MKEEELIKKAIEYNNLLHKYSVPETERNTLISAILIALQDSVFVDSFNKYEKNFYLVKEMLGACSRVLEKNKISDKRKDTILHEYSKIQHNQKLTSENIKDKSKNVPNVILKNLIHDLKNSVLPFIKENDFDILGQFYREFIRYAGSSAKTGLVLTPSHITDLFCELADLNYNDIVYDPCCGTGGFLVSAMKHMLSKSGNSINEWKEIQQNRLIGVEVRPDMFTHTCSNMMMRGDGKSNIYNGDCFDDGIIKLVKSHKPNKGFLNPPYDVGSDGQLEFIENTLECLVKGGKCIAICQMSTTIKQDNKTIEMRKRLLEHHTLEAVFSMPDQLFYPKGVVTSILVLTAHIPHPVNKEVFFSYFKDDGHILKKHKGRLDDGSWNSKKECILNLYINNKSEPGLSITKCVKAKDEWCAEAYMETDYSELTEEDFIKTIKDFIAFQFVNSRIQKVFPEPILNKKIELDVGKWRTFVYDDIFDISNGYYNKKPDEIENGNIPFIGATERNNGITSWHNIEIIESTTRDRSDNNHELSKKLFKGRDYITISNDGSVGYAFYQPVDFTCSHSVNPIKLKNAQLNQYIAMFLCTLIRLERYRWAYGRKWRPTRMPKSQIKLPVTFEGKPDWQLMQNYIKSLPYTKNLGFAKV